MKHFLSCIIFLLYATHGHTQRYRMESLTVVDGLSQGFVGCLLEDSRGFIWFGSLDGLNRYDGYQIKRFTNNPAPGALKANSIICMAEGANGLLWLGTEKGLAVMDPYTERFLLLSDINQAFPNNQLKHINIQDGGQIWLSFQQQKDNGVYVFLPPADLTGRIRKGRLQSSDFNLRPLALHPDLAAPLVWLASGNDTMITAVDQNGHFCQVNRAKGEIQLTDPRHLNHQRLGNYGVIHAKQNTMHFVFSLDTKFQQLPVRAYPMGFITIPGEKPFVYPGGSSALYQPDSSFFRSKGLETRLEKHVVYQPIKPIISVDKPLAYTNLVDRAGNLWIATTGYGVRKISRNKLDFKAYTIASGCYNITQLPDDGLWLGFRRPELVFNLKTGKVESPPWTEVLGQKTNVQSILITRSGDWWMIAGREGHYYLLRKDRVGKQWRKQPVKLIAPNDAIPLLEDSRGNIWLAGVQGQVIRIRPGNQVDQWQIAHLFPARPHSELHFTCLTEDEYGTLWLGSTQGLVRIDHPEREPDFQLWPQTGQQSPLRNDWVMSLYHQPNSGGTIWIGTRGGGLSRYDSPSGLCETFTESEGLINNVVYGILPDSFGYLWLSTNRGLTRFNPRNHTFSSFLHMNTQLNTEFNTGAYLTLSSGELAFGSVEGLFVVRPPKEPLTERHIVARSRQVRTEKRFDNDGAFINCSQDFRV